MSKIKDRIRSLPSDAVYFSLEFFPPKTPAGFQNLLPRLHRLRALNPLFVCVTFNAGGTTATKSLELADVCQNQLGLTTCLHLTCTNLKRGTIDFVLEECKRLGVRNILALRGDEPREGDYAAVNGTTNGHRNGNEAYEETHLEADDVRFTHAVDLITYIRRKHGSFFCLGAAAYPEGHATPSAAHPGAFYQSPEEDVPYLVDKVKAGADFFITQLFYDVDKFLAFEKMLRDHKSGVFERFPIIPGLFPVQGWQSFTRTCKLAKVGLPDSIRDRFHLLKGDDEGLKTAGVEVVSSIVHKVRKEPQTTRRPQGFHFYTLNLEKAVAQILERSELLPAPPADPNRSANLAVQSDAVSEAPFGPITIDTPPSTSPSFEIPGPRSPNKNRSRRSSAHNRVVVSRPAITPQNVEYAAVEDEVGKPREESKEDSLAIAEGEGSLGREATWDDFPNGRWGDARSPAYGSMNNYALHPQLSPTSALSLWSYPTSPADITNIFRRYLIGSLPANPWSEEGLSPETDTIRKQLLALNEKGWWTVASQPAVNACPSGDETFGWGPRSGGWVWQKPFVEFFLSSKDWTELRERLDALAATDQVSYFAGNAGGQFQASDEDSVNPVTWGAFKGKEIITPTIIEPVSFRAWQEEAFGIWYEWARVFSPSSPSAKLLENLRDDVWLVNVIGHDYIGGGRLWDVLFEH